MIGRFLNIFQLSAVQKAQRTVDKGFLDRAGIGGKEGAGGGGGSGTGSTKTGHIWTRKGGEGTG